LEDFWKGFQGYLDQLAWREIRLCVRWLQPILTASLIIRHP
jgi:nuclear cap-binding protein subunit 1